MLVAVKDLRSNPFRHLERYPIDREKVDALKLSIKDTTFWDNLIGRTALSGGGFELAYGHHRKIALEELGVKEIDIPIRDLSDETMLKIMAHENREEWAWSADIGQETIRAVVEAFGDGLIRLPKSKNEDHGSLRYAPSFIGVGKSSSGPQELLYTAATIAEFLRWNVGEIEAHLNSLAVVEKGLVDQDDFKGLSAYQAQAVATQVRRVEKETGKPALAKKIGKTLASGMHSTTGMRPGRGYKTTSASPRQPVTVHTARHVADQEMARDRRFTHKKPLPAASKAIPDLASKIGDLLTPDMTTKVKQVIAVKAECHPHDIRLLMVSLRDLAKRANKLADQLEI